MKLRELHCDVAHATGARVNEHRLARRYSRTQVQRLPRCLAHQRQRCGSSVIYRGGLAGSAASIDRDVFRIRAIPKEIGRGEDFVAGLPLGGARAAAHDDTADVVPQDQRERARRTATGADFRVDGIDRGRVHFDQHVRVSKHRLGPFLDLQDLGSAKRMDYRCAHTHIV